MAENESTLIKRAKEGDYDAFEQLVTEYEDRVYSLGLKMCSEEQDALEVVQDTFLSAYRNIQKFREDSSFYTWINRIAVNSCFQKLRKRKKEKNTISMEEVHPFPDGKLADASIPSWDFSPEKTAIKGELAEKMRSALEELPDKYRAVFYLKDIDGLSNKEIADIMDLSVPAVKSRLNRARLFLRKQLSPYFES